MTRLSARKVAAEIVALLEKNSLGRIVCRKPHQIALFRRQWPKPAEPAPGNEGCPASDGGEADDLAAARGVGVSLAIGIALWLAIIAAALLGISGFRLLF